MTDGRSKMLVAYHEVGHAVCASLTPGHDPVQKVGGWGGGWGRGARQAAWEQDMVPAAAWAVPRRRSLPRGTCTPGGIGVCLL